MKLIADLVGVISVVVLLIIAAFSAVAQAVSSDPAREIGAWRVMVGSLLWAIVLLLFART